MGLAAGEEREQDVGQPEETRGARSLPAQALPAARTEEKRFLGDCVSLNARRATVTALASRGASWPSPSPALILQLRPRPRPGGSHCPSRREPLGSGASPQTPFIKEKTSRQALGPGERVQGRVRAGAGHGGLGSELQPQLQNERPLA